MDKDEGFEVWWRWIRGLEGWRSEEAVLDCPVSGLDSDGGAKLECCSVAEGVVWCLSEAGLLYCIEIRAEKWVFRS